MTIEDLMKSTEIHLEPKWGCDGAFEVLWTENGEERKLRFTDMKNALTFTDLLLNARPNVGTVTIRRMTW